MRRLDVDTAEVVRLYLEEGLRGAEIATRLQCSDGVVYARLAEAGVPRSRRARLDRDEVTRLYVEEGLAARQIGERFDVAAQTVIAALRDWRVPTRSQRASLQPRGRRPCPVSVPFRAYLLGFAWGDLAVEQVSPGMTVAVRGSTTHAEQLQLIRDVFEPFGHVQVSAGSKSTCVRASLDPSFDFLLAKYGLEVPAWVRGTTAEAAFAAGYVDAEGSFGIYEGRARFKLDSYDAVVQHRLFAWFECWGIPTRLRLIARAGDERKGSPAFNGDLWRLNVNDGFGILRLAATLEPFLRHERRRARMRAAVANVNERLRSRAHA